MQHTIYYILTNGKSKLLRLKRHFIGFTIKSSDQSLGGAINNLIHCQTLICVLYNISRSKCYLIGLTILVNSHCHIISVRISNSLNLGFLRINCSRSSG